MTRPRIFVYALDSDAPSGGIRKLYRHVDVLCQAGFPAWVVHQQDGFRCSWFANRTPVASARQTPVSRGDYLVIPEVVSMQMLGQAPGVQKVIFNQNAYYTFLEHSLDPADLRSPYTSPDVAAALVVSADSQAYLTHVFPRLRVLRLRYGIDPHLFAYRADKRPVIAYMPRKNALDLTQVVNILKFRGALAGFELCPIQNRPEAEVAALLGESLLFLSFGHPEGFGLPPAEALACGCLVVGYHGRGGQEYFVNAGAYPVEVGDVIGFARAVEEVLGAYRADPGPLRARAERGAAWIRQHYSLEQEEADILACWQAILGEPVEYPVQSERARD
jgi:hypothetical protein